MATVKWLRLTLIVAESATKVIAVGMVPENRRPGYSQAWLSLILFQAVVRLVLFMLARRLSPA